LLVPTVEPELVESVVVIVKASNWYSVALSCPLLEANSLCPRLVTTTECVPPPNPNALHAIRQTGCALKPSIDTAACLSMATEQVPEVAAREVHIYTAVPSNVKFNDNPRSVHCLLTLLPLDEQLVVLVRHA